MPGTVMSGFAQPQVSAFIPATSPQFEQQRIDVLNHLRNNRYGDKRAKRKFLNGFDKNRQLEKALMEVLLNIKENADNDVDIAYQLGKQYPGLKKLIDTYSGHLNQLRYIGYSKDLDKNLGNELFENKEELEHLLGNGYNPNLTARQMTEIKFEGLERKPEYFNPYVNPQENAKIVRLGAETQIGLNEFIYRHSGNTESDFIGFKAEMNRDSDIELGVIEAITQIKLAYEAGGTAAESLKANHPNMLAFAYKYAQEAEEVEGKSEQKDFSEDFKKDFFLLKGEFLEIVNHGISTKAVIVQDRDNNTVRSFRDRHCQETKDELSKALTSKAIKKWQSRIRGGNEKDLSITLQAIENAMNSLPNDVRTGVPIYRMIDKVFSNNRAEIDGVRKSTMRNNFNVKKISKDLFAARFAILELMNNGKRTHNTSQVSEQMPQLDNLDLLSEHKSKLEAYEQKNGAFLSEPERVSLRSEISQIDQNTAWFLQTGQRNAVKDINPKTVFAPQPIQRAAQGVGQAAAAVRTVPRGGI